MPAGLRASSPRRARQPQLVSVLDLTGGVDLRRTPSNLAPDRAVRLQNWSIGEPGALTVEPGYTVVSSASFGATRCQGAVRAYVGGQAFTLVAYDGALYKPTDGWVRGAAVYSTLSSVHDVFFPYDRDLVMAMDSTNRPRLSTDGSTWVLAGTDAPGTGPTLSTLSTGGLTSGEYVISYTYKHRGTVHESNPSPASTITLTASSGAIHATAAPSTDPKVDAIVWYARHRSPDGESVSRKVSSGAASTVTITSSAWTANDEAPERNDPPPAGLQFGVVWKSRWWAVRGRRLLFTELFQPQSWYSLYYIDIPFEKGDEITALQPLGDTLLVYGQSGVYLIIGQTSLDFEVRPGQGSDGGAVGPRAVTRIEQSVLHASAGGVDVFDGATDRGLEPDIQVAWRDLVTQTPSTSLARLACVHDPLRQIVRIAVPRLYPSAAAGEWILDLSRTRDQQGVPAWTYTNRAVGFYLAWDGNEPSVGNRGRLFVFPADTSGLIYELRGADSEDASLNSSAVTAEYEGPTLTLGLHRARVIDLHVEYEPHGGVLTAEVVVDGVAQGAITLPSGAQLATYDAPSAQYDVSVYAGAGRRKTYTTLPLSAAGRSVAVRLTYTGQERMKLFAYHLTLLPEVVPVTLTAE